MDLNELIETDIWTLYQQAKNHCNRIGMYTDIDKCYRFYNGDQWAGLKCKGIEPVQLNFIKLIVKNKTSVINSNLWAVNFSSDNFENPEFRQTAERTCEMLNKKVARVWEKDDMDTKIRKISKDSCITSEGVMYVNYDEETQTPINEILTKADIYYGNENDSDIERQPYILIKQRLPIIEVQEMAKKLGISEEEQQLIAGDKDVFEQSGEDAKIEKDDMCTIITKLYKKDGKVHYSKATRFLEIMKDKNSGLTRYPVAHFPWEEKQGSARGEGEVRYLIPNQIEVNKNEMRRLLSVKQTAYPTKVANTKHITNPNDLDTVGGIIKTNGESVDDVRKILTVLNPGQMSPDAQAIQAELIGQTRDLASVSEATTGDIDPEAASGKAILAVQQAQQQPLTEQTIGLKTFLENLARIYLDMFIAYSDKGLQLEETITDETTGEEITKLVKVPQIVLEQLKATVKVDITPKGAFDKFAQEVTFENLLKEGFFNIQRLPELKIYEKLLSDDSVMPKQKLKEAIKLMEEEQQRIAIINAQAQMMQMRANQFLNADVDTQVDQIRDAQMQIKAENENLNNERAAMQEEGVPS